MSTSAGALVVATHPTSAVHHVNVRRLLRCFGLPAARAVVSVSDAFEADTRRALADQRVTRGLRSQIGSLEAGSLLLVDVENLRGKAGFRVDHGTIVAALACWARDWDLAGRVVLAFDHGSKRCGFYLPLVLTAACGGIC